MEKIKKFVLTILSMVLIVSSIRVGKANTMHNYLFANTTNNSSKYSIKYVSSDFSKYPTVRLYYKIYDGNGNIVNNYNIKKVILKEKLSGGEYLSREVKIHENIKNYGLNTGIVIDKSDSIDNANMSKIIKVTTAFVNVMNFNNGDKAELISFDNEYHIDCPFTNKSNVLNNAIKSLVPKGRTAFYDAVHCGIQNASVEGGARCVIAFTDGMDNESKYEDKDIIDYSNKLQVLVYIIGAGDSVDEDKLRNIAISTGGKYWNIDDLSDLEGIFNEIYGIEKSTYYIEYISNASGNNIYDERSIDLNLDDGNNKISFTHNLKPVIPAYIGHDTQLDFDKRLSLMYTVLDYPSLTDLKGIDSIPFGAIEQDNNAGNGSEPIDWIVIERNGDKALLLSKLIIDNYIFSINGSNNWQNSNIREYLNNNCINAWFSADEQKKIVANSDGDKISLLTEEQCRRYFGKEDSNGYNMRIASHCTDYLKSKATELNITIGSKEGTWYKGNSSFWLRTILSNNNAEYIGLFGKLNTKGDIITKNDGIRPVIWVKFK